MTTRAPDADLPITWRPATGLDDLRVAGALLSQAWLADNRHVSVTPGDLSWWFTQTWPAELGDHLRLWSAAGRTVAWSWHDPDDEVGPAEVEYHAWSGYRALDAEIGRVILATSVAGGGRLDVTAADDDADRLDLFARSGFARIEPGPDAPRHLTLSQYQRTTDTDIPDAPLPAGYRIRSVAGPDDIPARVEVHRAAFAPSRLTVDKYERLVTLPGYRFEDDLVGEAPDGSFAAFTMAWWDSVAQVGELEPVGTHPDHQRRGLGKVLLTHALRRYRQMGARIVQVLSSADNTASEALYRSVGFERVALLRRYRGPA